MKPLRNRLTAFCLLVAAVILGCGSAPVTTDPGRPLAMDAITLEYIGREALSKYGYDEIIRRAVDAGFLRYPTAEKTNAQEFIGQTWEEAARQAWPIFTQWAVRASITSQVDSPAPGPADAVALGMIVVGLVHAGVVAAMVLTTASAAATATASATPTATTTTTSPPIAAPRQSCPPCSPYSKGTIGYLGPHHDHDHYPVGSPHLNLFVVNQNPQACKCFWNKNNPDAVSPPPSPGWVNLNGGFPALSP